MVHGLADEGRRGFLWVTQLAEGRGDGLVRELGRQAVGTDQESVADDRDDLEHVTLDVGLDTKGAGEDRPVLVGPGIDGGELPFALELSDDRVVLRQLFEVAAP